MNSLKKVSALALIAVVATLVSSGASAGPSGTQCDITGTYPSLVNGGFYARINLATNLKLHASLTPTAQTTADLDANGAADVIASFTGLGTFKCMNPGSSICASWSKITNAEASWFAVGDLDDNGHDDLIIVFASPAGTFKYMGATSTLSKFHNVSALHGTTSDLDGDGDAEGVLVFSAPVSGTYKWQESLNAFNKIHNNEASMVVGTGDVNGSGSGEGNVVMTFAVPTGTWVYADSAPYYTNITPLTALVSTSGDVLNVGGDAQQVVLAADETFNLQAYEGTWILSNYATRSYTRIHPNDATIMNGTCNLDNTGGDDIAVSFAPTVGGMWAYLNNSSYVRQVTPDPSTLAVGDLDAL